MKHLHLALLGLTTACGVNADNDIGDGPCNGGPMIQSFADVDYDGYGDASDMVEDCAIPEGYTDNDEDCDDLDATVHPRAVEVCDGLDNNCDDDIDEGLYASWTMGDDVSSETLIHNSQGELRVRTISWTDEEGEHSQTTAYGYADGRVVAQDEDLDGDGEYDRSGAFAYDDQGRVVNEIWDEDMDNSFDLVISRTWGSGDQLLARTSRMDGVLVSDEAWTYDAAGRLLSSTQDLDGDGVNELVQTLEYDGQGRLTYRGDDLDDDGYDDVWTEQTWNADGTLQQIADFRAEGTFLTDFFYDEQGRLIREEKDDFYDLQLDGTTHYLWSEDDTQLTIRAEDGDDVVLWQRHEVHDEQGRAVSEQYDTDGDDVYESGMYRSWDEAGNLTMEAWDDDGDGSIDRMTLSTWDAEGRKLSHGEDADGDGVAEVQSRWTYDEQGRLATIDHDRDGDGTFEGSYAAVMECLESL